MNFMKNFSGAAVIAAAALWQPAAQAEVLFVDEFDNDIVADVNDTETDYWRTYKRTLLGVSVRSYEVDSRVHVETNDLTFGGIKTPADPRFYFLGFPEDERLTIVLKNPQLGTEIGDFDGLTMVVSASGNYPFHASHIILTFGRDRSLYMETRNVTERGRFLNPIPLVDAGFRLQTLPEIIEVSLDATRYEVIFRFGESSRSQTMDCNGFFFSGEHRLLTVDNGVNYWTDSAPHASISVGTRGIGLDTKTISLDAIEVRRELKMDSAMCPPPPAVAP